MNTRANKATANLVRLRDMRRQALLLEADYERDCGVSIHERTSLVDSLDKGIERCQGIIREEVE